MEEHGYIQGALVFLLAVVVAVPLFERLKLGAVLAYLVAGAVLGPHGLKLMRGVEEGFAIAELGVVLLLFLIGLELSYARLWLMRRAVFGLGALQVLATTLAIWLLATLGFGLDWRAGLIAGFALAMSSTAIGVQLLSDRRELGDAHGRAALAVLLFQDLVAIPAIALLPVLAHGESAPGWQDVALAVGKVVLAVAVVVAGSRYLLRPLFRIVARTTSVEAFTAMTLLVALGTAWTTSLAGVSMAFGAFLAGVLLADSEYRHEIEANIEPFKGLLLGLFFVTVGVSVDWFLVSQHLVRVVLGVVILLAVKFALLYLLGRSAGRLDRPGALRLAALLSQGGEFAFLLLTIAYREQLLPGADRDQITAVVVLSMALTPLIVLAIDRLVARQARAPKRPFDDPSGAEAPRVIIAGFGRVGQIVARLLTAHRIPFTALEQSVDQVELSPERGLTGEAALVVAHRRAAQQHAPRRLLGRGSEAPFEIVQRRVRGELLAQRLGGREHDAFGERHAGGQRRARLAAGRCTQQAQAMGGVGAPLPHVELIVQALEFFAGAPQLVDGLQRGGVGHAGRCRRRNPGCACDRRSPCR